MGACLEENIGMWVYMSVLAAVIVSWAWRVTE